jgi:hypothetical protein
MNRGTPRKAFEYLGMGEWKYQGVGWVHLNHQDRVHWWALLSSVIYGEFFD